MGTRAMGVVFSAAAIVVLVGTVSGLPRPASAGRTKARAAQALIVKEADNDDVPDAEQPRFRIPEQAIRRAKDRAAVELARPVDLKQLRPAGMEDLSTPEAIDRVIETAIEDLLTGNRIDLATARLRYLGDLAFDKVAAVVRDPKNAKNRLALVCCCRILSVKSAKGARALTEIVQMPDPYLRCVALPALARTMQSEAVPVLIERLQDPDFTVRLNAIQGLDVLKDLRAIPPLRQLQADPKVGQETAREAARVIQSLYEKKLRDTRNAAHVPTIPERLQKLSEEVLTFKREQFSRQDLELLQSLLKSDNPISRSTSLYILKQLQARSLVAEVLKDCRGGLNLVNLAALGSPQVVDHFVERMQRLPGHMNRYVVEDLGKGGRWAAPLLIALLDDPSLLVKEIASPQFDYPETHAAYIAMNAVLHRHGLPQRAINPLEEREVFDMPAEFDRLKKWWADNGEAFLSEKAVPNPHMKGWYVRG